MLGLVTFAPRALGGAEPGARLLLRAGLTPVLAIWFAQLRLEHPGELPALLLALRF